MHALLASLLLLSPASQAPDLSKKITFDRVAMPAKRLVQELGQSLGLPLDTSPQVAPDVLVVRFEGVTGQEALDRIASTVNGVWQEEEGVRRLIRPAGNANREAAAERQARIQVIRDSIKKQMDALNKKPGDPQDETRELDFDLGFMGNQVNVDRHILTLVSRLNPADLAGADTDTRIVFASNPNRMQKLLPGNLDPIVADLVAQHNKIAAEAAAQPDKEPENEMEKQMRNWMKMMGRGQKPVPIEGRPSKLLLIAEPQDFIGGANVTLRLFDSKGKVVVEGSTMFGESRFMEEAMEMATQSEKPAPAPAKDDAPIEFSATTKELSKIFSSFTENQARGGLTPETESKLLRPDLYDPLSFAISESFLASAKHKKLNLVALIPDTMTSMLDLFFDKALTINAFLESIKDHDEIVSETKDGWMTVRPKHPLSARTSRVDRTALAKLIGAAKARGSISLDDIAAYALTSPSPFEDSAAMSYLMLFAPSSMQMGMTGMVDWDAIRLYGTLSPDQKRNLMAGNPVSYSGLDVRQRGLVEKMMFGPGTNLKVIDPAAPPKTEFGFAEMMMSFANRSSSDFREEPTEAMPNGLPSAGFFRATVSTEPIGKVVGNDPMLAYASIGADELALFRMLKDDPNMAMFGGMMPTIEKLRLGERTNIHMRFFAREDVALERNLQDSRIDPNGPVYAMNDLPQAFKDKIEKRFQEFKKSPFPLFGFGGGMRAGLVCPL